MALRFLCWRNSSALYFFIDDNIFPLAVIHRWHIGKAAEEIEISGMGQIFLFFPIDEPYFNSFCIISENINIAPTVFITFEVKCDFFF